MAFRKYVKGPTGKHLIYIAGNKEGPWVDMYEFSTNTMIRVVGIEGFEIMIPNTLANANDTGGIIKTGNFNAPWILPI